MNDYTNNMFLRIETAMTLLRMELEQVNLKLTDMERSINRFETNSANNKLWITIYLESLKT